VTGLFGDAVHGFEDEDRELGANLVRIEVCCLDRPAESRRRVTRASLVHHQRRNVIRALLARAKLRVRCRKLGVYLSNRALERAFHPAIGSG
jgi:hypothetical protein